MTAPAVPPGPVHYGCGYRVAARPGDAGGRWLRDTHLLQLEHPKLRIQVQRLTQLFTSERDKAIACFQYVRALPFKCAADPLSVTAAQVLRDGSGDYRTKTTLMVALLRAAGVRARARHVVIGSGVMHGIARPESARLEHAFAEVLLDGHWLGVDAYGVDLRLGLAARRRLFSERRLLGYAIHLRGQVSWDGRQSAFALFNEADPASCPTDDFGVFDDVAQSWAGDTGRGASGWAANARWDIGAALINRRIKALRGTPARPRSGTHAPPRLYA